MSSAGPLVKHYIEKIERRCARIKQYVDVILEICARANYINAMQKRFWNRFFLKFRRMVSKYI